MIIVGRTVTAGGAPRFIVSLPEEIARLLIKNNKKRQIVLTLCGSGVMVDGGVLLEGDFVCLGSLLEGLR